MSCPLPAQAYNCLCRKACSFGECCFSAQNLILFPLPLHPLSPARPTSHPLTHIPLSLSSQFLYLPESVRATSPKSKLQNPWPLSASLTDYEFLPAASSLTPGPGFGGCLQSRNMKNTASQGTGTWSFYQEVHDLGQCQTSQVWHQSSNCELLSQRF